MNGPKHRGQKEWEKAMKVLGDTGKQMITSIEISNGSIKSESETSLEKDNVDSKTSGSPTTS